MDLRMINQELVHAKELVQSVMEECVLQNNAQEIDSELKRKLEGPITAIAPTGCKKGFKWRSWPMVVTGSVAGETMCRQGKMHQFCAEATP